MPWGTSVKTVETSRRVSAAADMADSDLNLIRSFRAGDEAAFDRLYGKYQDYVYNVCLGILGNPDDARDCAQESFLRVYRKVGDFRADSAFSTWLYRVTVNVCVGHRSEERRVGKECSSGL